MILNFVSLGKNCLALRRYVLCSKVINISRVLYQRMPNICTTPVICSNNLPEISYLKDGKDGEICPDEEYPEWLWDLKGTKQTLNELDPHSRTYNRLLQKSRRRDENERRKMKRF